MAEFEVSTSTRTTPKGNNTAIKLLHIISKLAYDPSVTEPISQILKAMRQRVAYEAKQLAAIETEKDQLAEAYHRYNELDELQSDKSRWLYRLESLVDKDAHALKYMSLWELLEIYLTFVPEAQVADILGFFEWLNYKTTRQAVESVIKTHKERFTVRKDGWDRFISLKRKVQEK